MNKKILKIVITAVVIGLIAFGAVSLLKKRKAQLSNLPTPEIPVYVVKGAIVKKGQITVKRTFLGKVYSDNEVKVSTKFGGYIKSVKINEGDKVKKGQIIATVDPTPVNLEIQNLKHNIDILKNQLKALTVQKEATEIALKTAENIYKRDLRLFKKKAISKEKLEISQTNYEKAKASYEAVLSNIQSTKDKIKETKNRIKIRQNDLNYLYIKSPVDGVVSRILLKEGNYAGKGKPIAVIQKTGNYKILVSLPLLLKEGTQVFLKTENSVIKTKINRVYPETDKNSLYTAEIRLNRLPEDIKIGSLINVDFIVSEKEGLIVPRNAIFHMTGGTYILTVKDSRFVKIPVKIVAEDEGNAIIKGDISEGTPVAVAEENKLRILSTGKKGKLVLQR
ncbi:RND family efflux transporter, MFP subunit [Persephonella hydrogeniphila]|uniref:RND family efflux transporter, MFP subunit n=1 Tax=Persephonella hydrogeniphila TaxID=198703 RepID=A0A285NFK6_9AQUI|nr:efflux RND transporter periplasmic adaptor subunit [Persephonella hydrogeniphila]SNZ08058.1 RND family efflux transporter, MFP subunit [Persephonella hydrogeniphila]